MKLSVCCEEMENKYGNDYWFDVDGGELVFVDAERGNEAINYCPYCGAKCVVELPKKAKKK